MYRWIVCTFLLEVQVLQGEKEERFMKTPDGLDTAPMRFPSHLSRVIATRSTRKHSFWSELALDVPGGTVNTMLTQK